MTTNCEYFTVINITIYARYYEAHEAGITLGHFLLTWFNFNSTMDK